MDVIKLYSNCLIVHIDASKEILLEGYKKKYKFEEIPRARVTRPMTAATSDTNPSAHPTSSKNFREQARRLLN